MSLLPCELDMIAALAGANQSQVSRRFGVSRQAMPGIISRLAKRIEACGGDATPLLVATGRLQCRAIPFHSLSGLDLHGVYRKIDGNEIERFRP